MVKKQETPAQVSPQIMSSVRPTTPLLQPTPEADVKLTQLAQKMGITREEVMDRILDSIPDEEQPKESFTDQSLRKVETARRLGLAGEDTSDPINLKARLKILKDMDKEDAMSMKEMLQMGLLLRILPPQDNQQQGGTQSSQLQQMIADMKTENEKQRQFYEDRLKDQEAKIRDMVFEKKIENLGGEHASAMSSLTTQLEDLSQRVELIRSIPPSTTPEQKQDAITQLENAGTQLERIKVTLGKFGLIPATPGVQTSALSEQGKEVYRNPDGSVNKVMYMVDRITGTIEKGFDAWQKKNPEKGDFVETPAPAYQEPQYTERHMSEEDYAEFLLSRPSLTLEQQQWLTNYRNYLLRQQAPPQTKVQEYKPPERREAAAPAVQPAEQPVGCMVCGRPEIYQEDLCEQCWNDQNRAPEQPKKGIIERLKEAEAEELRRTQGLL